MTGLVGDKLMSVSTHHTPLIVPEQFVSADPAHADVDPPPSDVVAPSLFVPASGPAPMVPIVPPVGTGPTGEIDPPAPALPPPAPPRPAVPVAPPLPLDCELDEEHADANNAATITP